MLTIRSAGARALLTAALVTGLGLTLPTVSVARVFATVGDALAAAFPGCEIERQTTFLTEEQATDAARLAGRPVETRIVHPYVARCNEQHAGTAYFDAHRVRTLPETLMIVVDPDGRVERLEVLSFDEPVEYIPRPIWYEQFDGELLDDDLAIGLGIDGVSGATLTARATTEAVRRVLALHESLEPIDR